jgi:norsolorinic acid ketoreductase
VNPPHLFARSPVPRLTFSVSGASRGIGYKFIEDLSARQNVIVFAGVRSLPLAEDSQLAKLAARLPEVVFPIQLNSGNVEDNMAAAELVSDKVGKVDVVIANAGMSTS